MATYHFVGPDGAALDNAAVWSATQGGAGGAGTPGSLDTAIFDQTNPSLITVTVGISIGTVWVKSTAKVNFQPESAAVTFGTLKNDGQARLSGQYIIDNGESSSIGTAYFVVGTDIQNTGTLEVDQDFLLRGGVSVQSGTFGWSGVLQEGQTADTSTLWLGAPGGTFVPGVYEFAVVGPPMHNLQSLDTTALDDALDQDAVFTFSPGVYEFNALVPTASHLHACTTVMADCDITVAWLIATSQGAQATLDFQGSTISMQGRGTGLAYFLIGTDENMELLWDQDTLVKILPPTGLDPETVDLEPFLAPTGGTVILPPIEVQAQGVLVTDNPLGLPNHHDSIRMLPESGCLQNFNEGHTITVDHDWACQDGFITSLSGTTVNLGGNFTFSGHILSFTPFGGPLERHITGDLVVTGTYLTVPDKSSLLAYLNPPLGDQYRRSLFSVGTETSAERLFLDVQGDSNVQDLETYYAISTRDIVSPSSIGCGNIRFEIESNCPGTAQTRRLDTAQQDIEQHKHASGMAWRTGRG